ncbi:MAG: peptidylprolyl isomerase [Rhodobacteraceae bacterium]|nr:peptidylprolyl isomerase [Paracoccaceae bacterium]
MARFLILTLALLWPAFGMAQSQFRTVVTVDNAAVTAFEVEQRLRLLRALNTPGASRESALEQLIEDRLKQAAARRAGLSLTEEGLERSLTEFAGRANLTVAELQQTLRAQGVEPETLTDFVSVGVIWRELIRSRFGDRATISEAEIDRAVGGVGQNSSIRVLLNEIVLPARPIQNEAAEAKRNADRIARITSISAFQAEARQLSASPSRERSGRLNWLNLSELPPALAPILLDLVPGEVSAPIELENAILLFQLRAIEEVEQRAAAPAAIDYAALYLPGGRSERTLRQAQEIAGRVDTCDDLYGEARNMPREALERGSKVPTEIPDDVAIELAKLDAGEVSTTLTRSNGETLVFLMMCARVPSLDTEQDRNVIRARLRSQRLTGYADGFLAELRAQAVVRTQ